MNPTFIYDLLKFRCACLRQLVNHGHDGMEPQGWLRSTETVQRVTACYDRKSPAWHEVRAMRYLCHLLVAPGDQVCAPSDHQGHVDIPALVSQPLLMFLGLIIIIKIFSYAFSMQRPTPTTDNLSNRNEFFSWLREHLRRQHSRPLDNSNVTGGESLPKRLGCNRVCQYCRADS
jgi:hypothetical protein